MARPETDASPAARAMLDVIDQTARAFFRLRAAGMRSGAVTRWGGGLWGFLRSLARDGPQTVPRLARARPVSRQRIQKLADELAADGLVEFIDNPAHRRSRLVRLTAEGEAAYEEITGRLLGMCEALAEDMAEEDLHTTTAVLAALRRKLEAI